MGYFLSFLVLLDISLADLPVATSQFIRGVN